MSQPPHVLRHEWLARLRDQWQHTTAVPVVMQPVYSSLQGVHVCDATPLAKCSSQARPQLPQRRQVLPELSLQAATCNLLWCAAQTEHDQVCCSLQCCDVIHSTLHLKVLSRDMQQQSNTAQ